MSITTNVLHAARQVKHAGFIASKRGRVLAQDAKFKAVTTVAGAYSRLRPYEFDRARYRRSFVVRDAPNDNMVSQFPRRVFVLWTGDNPLTPNRSRNLDLLRERIGLPVELITPATLAPWLVDGHPLHPAYGHLSLVHRSDYLRAYLLHHHGGGYCDLKLPLTSWDAAFDRVAGDPDIWVAGFGELSSASVVRLSGRLGVDVSMHHQRLVGTSSMLARSHTSFTAEWLREVNRRMDYYAPQLAEYPGGVRGEVVGYPISWTRLLGGVFQPLQLKYLSHVRRDDELLLRFSDYQ